MAKANAVEKTQSTRIERLQLQIEKEQAKQDALSWKKNEKRVAQLNLKEIEMDKAESAFARAQARFEKAADAVSEAKSELGQQQGFTTTPDEV